MRTKKGHIHSCNLFGTGKETHLLALSPYSAQKMGIRGLFWANSLLRRESGYGIIHVVQKKGIRPAYGMVVNSSIKSMHIKKMIASLNDLTAP